MPLKSNRTSRTRYQVIVVMNAMRKRFGMYATMAPIAPDTVDMAMSKVARAIVAVHVNRPRTPATADTRFRIGSISSHYSSGTLGFDRPEPDGRLATNLGTKMTLTRHA